MPMKFLPFFSTFQTLSKRYTRAFLLCAALWVGLSASICRADEDFEPSNFVTVDDLTDDQFLELSSLAIAVRSAAGLASSSGNITNDVAAILAILQNAVLANGRIITVPYTTGNLALQNYLFGLGEDWTSSSAARNKSFLYEIQRALYGQQGVPSASNAIQPILLRLLANSSWTNDVSALVDLLTNVDASTYSMAGNVGSIYMDLSSVLFTLENLDSKINLDYLYPIFTNQVAFADWISGLEYGQGSQWGVHLDDVQFGDLMNRLIDGNVAITNAISGPQDTWDDMFDVFSGIEQYLKTIHEDDFDFDGGGDRSLRLDLGYWNAQDQTRSIAADLHFLHQQIGVENPSSTNNIFSLLRDLASVDVAALSASSNALESASSSAYNSATNAFVGADSNIQNVASNSIPDFQEHSYGSTNPYSELDGLASAAKRQFESALPDIPDATDSTIVLFRGNMPLLGGRSNTRAGGSSVYLDISYPLRDWDAVSGGLSTMNGIMEVVWDLVALGLILWMYKRFYDDIMSGNFEKGVEQ